jgi:hypothetical protein
LELDQVFAFGITQVIAIGGAELALIANQITDVFGIPVATVAVLKFDPLEFDLSAGIVLVLEPDLDICAGVAEWGRDWFGDWVGPDVGFKFRKRKCSRAQDERSCDCERYSFHGLAPCLVVKCYCRTGALGFPSTSTGGNHENMSLVFFAVAKNRTGQCTVPAMTNGKPKMEEVLRASGLFSENSEGVAIDLFRFARGSRG